MEKASTKYIKQKFNKHKNLPNFYWFANNVGGFFLPKSLKMID